MNDVTSLAGGAAPPTDDANQGDLAQTARVVGSAAREGLHDLRDAAQSSLEDVKSAAVDKTDEVKGKTADEIARTARGLEAAADEMDGSPLQQDLLREAADGLKHIAQAVEGKSIGAMVGSLSEFGRQNPLAYLGGAALAGFALARFARASSPESASGFGSAPLSDNRSAYRSDASATNTSRPYGTGPDFGEGSGNA